MAGREVRSINKKLTEDERQRHRRVREQMEQERDELVTYGKKVRVRHGTLRQAVAALKAAREALGLTLADIRARTGIAKSNLSRLENDPNPNPTIDTLYRYADAVGKEIAITLIEKAKVGTSETKSNLT
jgi:DNA-binding XRE family transcriptional regulator